MDLPQIVVSPFNVEVDACNKMGDSSPPKAVHRKKQTGLPSESSRSLNRSGGSRSVSPRPDSKLPADIPVAIHDLNSSRGRSSSKTSLQSSCGYRGSGSYPEANRTGLSKTASEWNPSSSRSQLTCTNPCPSSQNSLQLPTLSRAGSARSPSPGASSDFGCYDYLENDSPQEKNGCPQASPREMEELLHPRAGMLEHRDSLSMSVPRSSSLPSLDQQQTSRTRRKSHGMLTLVDHPDPRPRKMSYVDKQLQKRRIQNYHDVMDADDGAQKKSELRYRESFSMDGLPKLRLDQTT